jgi:hypothetical protein
MPPAPVRDNAPPRAGLLPSQWGNGVLGRPGVALLVTAITLYLVSSRRNASGRGSCRAGRWRPPDPLRRPGDDLQVVFAPSPPPAREKPTLRAACATTSRGCPGIRLLPSTGRPGPIRAAGPAIWLE